MDPSGNLGDDLQGRGRTLKDRSTVNAWAVLAVTSYKLAGCSESVLGFEVMS